MPGWRMILAVFILMLASGCIPTTADDLPWQDFPPTSTPRADLDDDGFTADEDCDDEDPLSYPGAGESCDERDNDCDGDVDEDVLVVSYPDGDGDGFGDPLGEPSLVCPKPPGYVNVAGDCNDTDPTIYPGAVELCDLIDSDCNGIPEPLLASWYPDGDGDGFGDPAAEGIETCEPAEGDVPDNSDCDDTNPDLYPAVVDVVLGRSDGTGSALNPFNTIQAGVAAPGTCRTVVVRPGTYEETVSLLTLTDLVIRSTGGFEQTTLQQKDGARPLVIQGSSGIEVGGFTITTLGGVQGWGAGVQVYQSSAVVLRGLSVVNNTADGTASFGGGIGVSESDDISIFNSVFSDNQADFGGGVGLDDAEVVLEGCTFTKNSAALMGGGLSVGDVEPLTGPSAAYVFRSSFDQNSALLAGSAILADLGDVLEVEESTFNRNKTTSFSVGYAGGAVFNPARVARSLFLENSSASYSGAIQVRESVDISNNLFWRNTVTGSIGLGGAICVYESAEATTEKFTDVLVRNNTFVDNKAAYGNDLYYYDAREVVLQNNIFYSGLYSNASLFSVEIEGDLIVESNDFYSVKDTNPTLADDELDFLDRDGNFDLDPEFVSYDPTVGYSALDFHLGEESPCQGVGTPWEGEEERPDLGAYGGPEPLP